MNLADYKESPEKQTNGARIKIGGAIFTIRRLGTKESDKKLAEIKRKKINPYETLEDWERSELDKEITGEWLATYGVTHWAGLYEPEGDDEIEYSKTRAWEIFTDPDYYLSLNAALIQKCTDINNFLHDNIKEDIEQIKKKIEFDVQFPTKEEKLAYIKACNSLGDESNIPELNGLQSEILRVLYEADREREKDSYLKESQIKPFIEYVPIDLDLALNAVKELDSYMVKKRVEKHDREANKSKAR